MPPSFAEDPVAVTAHSRRRSLARGGTRATVLRCARTRRSDDRDPDRDAVVELCRCSRAPARAGEVSYHPLLPPESLAYTWLGDWGINPGRRLHSSLRRPPVDHARRPEDAPGLWASVPLEQRSGPEPPGLYLADSIGPEHWKLAGQFTGTYTGGGLNFSALQREFGTEQELFTAARAADILVNPRSGYSRASRRLLSSGAADHPSPLQPQRRSHRTRTNPISSPRCLRPASPSPSGS